MRFLRLSSLILFTEGLIKGPDFKLETQFLSPEAIDEFLDNLDFSPQYHYKTYENDNLVAIEMADKRIGKDNNEYIVIECGINPSHWIAIHSCLNLLQNPSAIELTGKDPLFMSSIRILVVPVFTKSGYDYTWNNDRRWAKNRQTTENFLCPGISLNNNFDYEWEEQENTNPCSDMYMGTEPNSAIEIQSLFEITEIINVIGYISVQQSDKKSVTYSSNANKIENRAEIFLAEKIANALGRFSSNGLNPFDYETEINELTSGSSIEYFRSLNPDVFAYQISLNADVLDSAANIEKYSLALMGAVEIIWKNADKRSVFTPTALDDYVWRQDDTYSWFNVEDLQREDEYSRTYVLNVTSQTWLDDSIMDRSIWWHYAVLIVPKVIRVPDAAMSLIVGWSNKESNDPASVLTRSDTKRLTNYAIESGIISVAVYQTPNQPITFVNDPLPNIYRNGRSEDGIIARTWSMFKDDPTEPDVLLRLPMTKGVVKCLDTVETFLQENLSMPKPIRWGATGASKRGWTTWTLGAVDYERIIFISPVWLDNLNLIPSTHHHYRSMGGWTYNYFDYYVEGFTTDIDSAEYVEMCKIIDPYSYLGRYGRSQTVLVQNAGNDEFFLPSDTWFFWDEMFGEKYLKIYQNKGHGGVGLRETFGPETAEIENIVWQTINGVFEEVLNPEYFKQTIETNPWTWTLSETEQTTTIELVSTIELSRVQGWMSFSATPDRRDWRKSGLTEYVCPGEVDPDIDDLAVYLNTTYYPVDVNLEESTNDPQDDLYIYNLTLDQPKSGYITYFIAGEVDSDKGTIYFTTQANIAPNRYDYEDCSGDDCLGCLI